MEKHRQSDTPCGDQTAESVEAWLRTNVKPGVEVVIRETEAGLLRYERAQVVHIGGGRFEVAAKRPDGKLIRSGQTFYYSGKNCRHPKGQTRIVIPTEAVLKACDECGPGYLPGIWNHVRNF